jgi:predicted dinucleotide-binding enzyme
MVSRFQRDRAREKAGPMSRMPQNPSIKTARAALTAGGLRAIDAGSLRRARELEAMGLLQIALAAGEKISWSGGFAVQP